MTDQARSSPRPGLVMDVTLETRLAALEAVVERGVQTFVEVGAALMEIRDARLYRLTHDTFEDYCRERWGYGEIGAYARGAHESFGP